MIAKSCSSAVFAVTLFGATSMIMGCAAAAPAYAQTTQAAQDIAPAPAAAECPPALSAVPPLLEHFDGYRVFTGPDGDSAVEPLRIDARQVTLPYNGQNISIFNLPLAPTRPSQIVMGPANMELPLHPAPYPEMFILLAGSFTLKTKTFSAEMKPGSVVLFNDVDATVGHGGTIGPCGYVSLSVAP